MSPRAGVILGSVMLVLYIAISMMSGPKGDPYGQENVSRNYEVKPVVSHPSEEAYLLVLEQEVAPGTSGADFDAEIKEAIRKMLEEAMDGQGLNLADYKGRGKGDLGEVHATVMLKDREYKGTGSQSFQRWYMPFFVKLSLEVSTIGSTSTWEEPYSVEAEFSPPSTLREGGLLGARTSQIESLMQILDEKLESRGPFHHY